MQSVTSINKTFNHFNFGKLKERINSTNIFIDDLKYEGTSPSKYSSFVEFEKELACQFEMENDAEIISFIFHDLCLMNVIKTVTKKINEYLGGNLELGLKLVPENNHENILQICIKGFNPDNTAKYFELEENLINCLNRDDLNKIQLFLEY